MSYGHVLEAYALIIVSRDNNLLMLKRSPDRSFAPNLYCMPGGRVEKGETFRRAVIREAHEEIGIDVQQDDLKFAHTFYRNNGKEELVVHVFECTRWSGEPFNKEPDKHSEMMWYAKDALPDNMILPHRRAIELVGKGIFYSEHLNI